MIKMCIDFANKILDTFAGDTKHATDYTSR